MNKERRNCLGKVENRDLTLAVVSAVNDEEILANNLASSPMIDELGIPIIAQRGYKLATRALNDGLDKADADIVIFAHQDVYFPKGWEKKLFATITSLESAGKTWGVLGVIGADKDDNLLGGVWATGLNRKIVSEFVSPAPAATFDEVVIILRKNSGLRFDPDLPSFHLYATDIVLSSLQAGLGAYVFDAPVIHNSLWCKKFGRSYMEAYRYMQRKWWTQLPAHTLVVPITQTKWPALKIWCRQNKRWLKRKLKSGWPKERHGNLLHLAQKLGYEFGD